VCHFAPTISPAPKDFENKEIESISKALEYYKNNNISEVIIQPKYMGSYCDILVKENINNSVFFSRKGYVIEHINREKLITALQPIHDRISQHYDWNVIDDLLIQTELTPWAAMGKKLIEREFTSYNDINKIHIAYLKESNIFDKINNIKNSDLIAAYNVDKKILTTEDFNNKYKQHEIRNNEAFNNIDLFDLDIVSNSVQKHREQIDLYGFDSDDFEIKPFNILKAFHKNGDEILNESNIYGFTTLNDDKCVVLDLNDFDIAVEKAYNYFNVLTNNEKMEGVVVKPTEVYVENIAPMFKVRNNNYLTLIYGVEFDYKFDYYLSRRKIDKKVKASINEWKISQALLRINKKDINTDNEYYVDLVEKRIYEEKLEENLDSRL
jgi:hypothetical protein